LYFSKNQETKTGLSTSGNNEVLTVREYRPQNDHVEWSDLAKRFFIAR
jgi:hypothetical protein